MLEWVTSPFSRGSSQPMDGTRVSWSGFKINTDERLSSSGFHCLYTRIHSLPVSKKEFKDSADINSQSFSGNM